MDIRTCLCKTQTFTIRDTPIQHKQLFVNKNSFYLT